MRKLRREATTLSLSADHQLKLEKIALELGCKWGEAGNISEMLRRIADGRIEVGVLSSSTKQAKDKENAIAKIQAGLIQIQKILTGL